MLAVPDSLFNPDNLSVGSPAFSQLTDEACVAEIAACLHDYDGIEKDAPLEIALYGVGNPRSSKYRVTVGGRVYFMKSRWDGAALETLRHEAISSDFLRKHGITEVPSVIPPSNGDSILYRHDKYWMLQEFRAGGYFSGDGSELDSAALLFARIAKACTDEAIVVACRGRIVHSDFVDDLPALLSEVLGRGDDDPRTAPLVAANVDMILEAARSYGRQIHSREPSRGIMHTDFHPLNILVRQGRVDTVMDLEGLGEIPLVAGLGYCGYKLIRELLVNRKRHGRWPVDPGEVDDLTARWLAGWQSEFPQSDVTKTTLLAGAGYRILFHIHRILHLVCRRNDESFLYDLPKQIRSLTEIRFVFG